ncbi:MAG: DUF177 domain-containing protein [Candidatus Omnitrophica bacterium]|nr:DUF177 domain-containing protein [Candidatus Omnitrophota bacterium]
MFLRLWSARKMRLDINSINEEPITREESIKASTWGLDTHEVEFTGEINLCCEFRKIDKEILVKVSVSSLRKIRCSRCLQFTTKDLTQDFYLSYDKSKLGQFLEVDDRIREEMLLEWPMKPLCKDDCKGICPGCGKNLNLEKCTCKK